MLSPLTWLVVPWLTSTAVAAEKPPAWPYPWPEGPRETFGTTATPAAGDSPLGAACQSAVTSFQALATIELSNPKCAVERQYPGVAPLDEVAVLRLTGEGVGVTDVWLLALRDAEGWHVDAILANGSWSGVGGWSGAVQLDGVDVTADAAGVAVIARTRTWFEDTDASEQFYWWSARVTVCHAAMGTRPRCATVTTATRAIEESNEVDTGADPAEESTTRTVRDWERLLTWHGETRRFDVGRARGKPEPGVRVRPLKRYATASEVVSAYAPAAPREATMELWLQEE